MNHPIHTRAPGKIILCGEHAVVHGRPALVTAVDRYAHCHVRTLPDRHLILEAPAFADRLDISWDEALRRDAETIARYDAFLAGQCAIRDVLRAPSELLIHAVLRALGAPPPHGGLSFALETDLPVGCGMGSSAAVTSALLLAAHQTAGKPPATSRLFQETLDCERLQHGHPSGVDPYASVHGGCVRYRKGDTMRSVPGGPRAILLAHSGIPRCTTGECVLQVKKNFEHASIWDDFERVCDEFSAAWESGDRPALARSIQANHRLLVAIGVVPPRVQAFVQRVEESGGAAKICGAGAVRGDGGGMIWIENCAAAAEICRDFGYDLLQVRREPRGAQILPADNEAST